MSEENMESIAITLGDQTFRVRIVPEERERFVRIAQNANATLREVLENGGISGPRALAMALFQLAVELDDAREALRAARVSRDERLRQIINRIDDALDSNTRA